MSLMPMYQQCTYWGQGAWDADGGMYSSTAPALLSCRWQDQQKIILESTGLEIMSSAAVYLPQQVAPTGTMMLGDQTQYASAPAGARAVLAVGRHITVGGVVDHWKVLLK